MLDNLWELNYGVLCFSFKSWTTKKSKKDSCKLENEPHQIKVFISTFLEPSEKFGPFENGSKI